MASLPLVLLLLHLISSFPPCPTAALNKPRPFNNTISAAFIFGDSTVDTGNNNFIHTFTKCNFPPYGTDFDQTHTPTGRFTNGRLATDFVAAYIGINDYIPPYLNSSLTIDDMMSGVSFASGGTGFDPLTAQINGGVITLEKQLEYFREYRTRLEKAIGKEETQVIISKALFLISAGTNDFMANYYITPFRQMTYTVPQYQQFLLQLTDNFLQSLMEEGARVIGVVGLPPIGCLPAVITLFSGNPVSRRGCVEELSAVSRQYNTMVQNKLRNMQTPSTKLVYADIYKPLDDMIKNPGKYGFEEVGEGCCGSGYIEAAILCNPGSVVCSDASKYVFWDAVHPTQAAYYNLYKSMIPIVDSIL